MVDGPAVATDWNAPHQIGGDGKDLTSTQASPTVLPGPERSEGHIAAVNKAAPVVISEMPRLFY
jgi:hypothetical protein